MIIWHTSEFFWKAKCSHFSLATSSSHWAYGSHTCCLCCYAFVWVSSGSQISPRAAILFVMCLTMAPSLSQLALWIILCSSWNKLSVALLVGSNMAHCFCFGNCYCHYYPLHISTRKGEAPTLCSVYPFCGYFLCPWIHDGAAIHHAFDAWD